MGERRRGPLVNAKQKLAEDRLRANTIATYAVEVLSGRIDPERANFGWEDRRGRREDVTREVLEAVDRFRSTGPRVAP